MLDFSGSGQLAVGDVGVYAPLEGMLTEADNAAQDKPPKVVPPAAQPRYFVLGLRRGIEYLYGGTMEPRRSGRVFPAREVLDALADCPFLHASSIVAVSTGGPTLEYRFVLIGFTGVEPHERFLAGQQGRIDELLRVLTTRLSADHRPDHIELFPCYARVVEGQVDHRWCREQYMGGVLVRKQQSLVFQHLTALRGALAGAPVGAPIEAR